MKEKVFSGAQKVCDLKEPLKNKILKSLETIPWRLKIKQFVNTDYRKLC